MSGPRPRGRLTRKYAVVFLLLVGGVLMASSLVEVYFSYQETKRAIVRVERAKAVAAATRLEQFVKEIERQVRETTYTASDDPTAAQFRRGKLGFREGLGAALAVQRELDFLRLLRSIPAVTQVSHLDLAGREQLRVSRFDVNAVGGGEDFSQAPQFVETRSGKTYWSPVSLRNGWEPHMTLAVPVGTYAVEVTTADINLKAVQKIIAELEVGGGGYAYVVDSQGRLFAHPNLRLVRQKRDLSDLPQIRAARVPGVGASADERIATVAGGLQGGQVLAAHAAVAPVGWLVVVEHPLADAFAPLWAPIVRSVVIFVLGLGLSVLASVWLARRMVAPIRVLQAGAARIGAGELGHRIEVRTGDELEALGDQLNQTAAQLQESYANLEGKVEARTRELSDSLKQQTATGDVLRVIGGSQTDLEPVFDTITRNAVQLCDGLFGAVFRFDGQLLHLAAHHNFTPELLDLLSGLYPMPPEQGQAVGRAILTRTVAHIEDALEDTDYRHAVARRGGWRSMIAAPMVREGAAVGALWVARAFPGPFSQAQIELLRTFADQAVIAIENVRLFTELEGKNRDLTESLEQQTAMGEILRLISSSPTDVQPTFDAIARRAVDLCQATHGGVFQFDGERIHLIAQHGLTPDGAEVYARTFPRPPARDSAIGRAILDRAVVDIPDVQADPAYGLTSLAQAGAIRSVVAVPVLRGGTPIGGIVAWRSQSRRFAREQVELLKTFADQAVIAIENVRLFRQLQDRTGELSRSVEELKALAAVGQAVTSTLDLQEVLTTIVTRAVQLSRTDGGTIYEFDQEREVFVPRANYGISAELVETLRQSRLRVGDASVVGQAAERREPVQIADLLKTPDYLLPSVSEAGFRALLAVPLLREGRIVGSLAVRGRAPGEFSEAVVDLLQTFASQSVLAIQNARLFQEVQRQKEYSEALVQHSPVAIVTVDLTGHVASWNPTATRLFGYAQAEAIGRDLDDLITTPEIREEAQGFSRRTLAGERIETITRRSRRDGTLVDVAVSSVPVAVEGKEVGYIAIYHDITELLSARREAEAANEAKSAFLATMSHEIRTPMNAIIGMSGLLLNTELGEEQREYAEVIRQSGDGLLTVINDILDFSKIEAGRMELESQPFDLQDCVETALDLVAARAADKQLDLAYLMGDGIPVALVGDVTRLRQVLLNLLSNAIKFTDKGEVVLSVSGRRLDRTPDLHEVTFSVRDTGIGIPPERVGGLFQSFSQVDASTARKYGGTGLGLAISKRLTELMGGRIRVASEVGRGSEFRFSIRVREAEAPTRPRRDLRGRQAELGDKTVLVVDDNETNRRILSAQLAAWGVEARATGSPQEALDWVRAGQPFDLAILDMHMPEMDGLSLARALREHRDAMALPLVLFTSLGRREAGAEEVDLAGHLTKPVKPSQLFDVLAGIFTAEAIHVTAREVTRIELDPEMGRRHPLRILLAEDNVVNQKVALRLLAQLGYRADVASNGIEAIQAVERQSYDAVLMDVQMPEMDGLEASRAITGRWPSGSRPRIIAMTANAMPEDRDRCLAAGMDDYVSKPIRETELVAALTKTPPRSGESPRGPSTVGVATLRSATPLGAASGAPESPQPAPRTPPRAPLDAATFERFRAKMGAEFIGEVLAAFVDDSRQLISTLRRTLGSSDVDAFRRAAHSLKSNAASLGAARLTALAKGLEDTAKTGRLDGVDDPLEELAGEYEAVARALGDLGYGTSA